MPESRPPATYVSDLRPNRVATLEADVESLSEPREVEVGSGLRKVVRDARLKDATGEVTLVLWGKEGELVGVGDRIRITEGWVKDYKGRLQISLGRTGSLSRVHRPRRRSPRRKTSAPPPADD